MTIGTDYFRFVHLREKQKPGHMKKVSLHEAKGGPGAAEQLHTTLGQQLAALCPRFLGRGSVGHYSPAKHLRDGHSGGDGRSGWQR